MIVMHVKLDKRYCLQLKAHDKKSNTYLHKVLTWESGPGVEWLIDNFGLDLSLVSRLGGHSQPRTHRGGQKFPGMTITFALMEKLEEVAEKQPEKARIMLKAKMTKLLKGKLCELLMTK